ncbi:hypothetical protein [Rhodoflexus caldus]|uniref:hypothetical protein n=1 Tax=Rhodoflexus caldus TaxID=2891236 RepID=UPI002029FC42|nr:hypothetical protein [Rhodoflexus caldus]
MTTHSETLLKVAGMTLTYINRPPCLRLRHVGYNTDEEFMEFQRKTYEIFMQMRQTQPKLTLLIDFSESEVVSLATVELFNRELIPLYTRSGRFRGALLASSDPFNRISVEEYIQGAIKTVMQMPDAHMVDAKQKIFEDEASALAWLEKQMI